jgi:hypothetical protein
MSGGVSVLLSGTGVPSFPFGGWRSPGEGFVGGDLEAKGLEVEGLAVEGLAGEGLVGMTLTMVFPPPEAAIIDRRDLAIRTGTTTWRRHAGSNRGGVSFVALDKVALQRRLNGTADLRARLLVQSIQ